MNKEIGALTGLRGIAAAWVLLLHVSHALRGTSDAAYQFAKAIGVGGFLGVDIFFVLSGFVLAYNYSDAGTGSSFRSYVQFLWKRLARIYPVHIAALVLFSVSLLAAIALDLPASLGRIDFGRALIETLTLTHAWHVPVHRSWNVVSWSISAEWAAYICFPVISWLVLRLNSRRWVLITIAALYAALAYAAITGEHRGTMSYGLIRIFAAFPAGVLLFRLWTISGQPTSSKFDGAALIALLTMLIGGNYAANRFGSVDTLAVAAALSAVLVYCLACSSGMLSRILSSSIALHLGRISFAFYMVHLTIISIGSWIVLKHGMQMHAAWVIGAAVLVAYAVAVWFYRSIEEPARRWMLTKSSRWADGHHRVDQRASLDQTDRAVA